MNNDLKGNKKITHPIDSNELHNALQDFYSEGIAIINEDGYFTYTTATAQTLLGATSTILASLRLVDLVHPEDCSTFNTIFKNASTAVNSIVIDNLKLLLKDGAVKVFEGNLINKLNDSLINGFVFTFRIKKNVIVNNPEMTKYSTENAFENNLFNQCVLASLTDQVAVLSADGTILAVNRAWEEFAEQLGTATPENGSVGSNYLAACNNAIDTGEEEVFETVKGILSVINKEVPSYHKEYPCFTPDLKKWFILNVLPFGGDDTKIVITHQDITNRKLAEDKLSLTTEKLKITLSKLSAILDSSLDLICTINSKMEFETVNNASLNILGFLPEELIGKIFMDFVHKDDVEKTFEAAEKIYEGNPEYLFENRYIHKNGKSVPLLWSVIWDNNLGLMYCVAKDMTESKKLQKSIEIAEGGYKGLVIGNDATNFSVGANLMMISMMAMEQEFDELDIAIRQFQQTTMRCRYSAIPVVSAPHGMTLGGGCEVTMHSDAVVASAETYIGLVEVGVG